jgi:hypothetical protein
MAYFYDEETETSYYENTIVVEFRQLEKGTRNVDMRAFMLYDSDEDLIYLYGSRKSDKFSNYPTFAKTFNDETQLYDFLDILMDFSKNRIDTAVHQIDYLTDSSDFDDIVRNVTNHTELSGFDNAKITKKTYKKYLNSLTV